MEKFLRPEGAVLLVLSLVLVSVFSLSVWMYDDLSASAEDGALSVFASEVRDFVDHNAVFASVIGLEEPQETETDTAAIAAMVEEYIARYNGVYQDLE